MDQAKWYYICFNPLYATLKAPFHRVVFIHQMKEELEIKRISTRYYKLQVFCGKKKLKKLIIEANLLGLEDSLIIFERRKGNV